MPRKLVPPRTATLHWCGCLIILCHAPIRAPVSTSLATQVTGVYKLGRHAKARHECLKECVCVQPMAPKLQFQQHHAELQETWVAAGGFRPM
jgi:hypothetical protein